MAGVLDIDSPDFDADAFVSDIAQRGEAADEGTIWQKMYDKQEADQMFPGDSAEKAWGFIKKLPKNITVGATNAGLAMAGLLDDIGGVISGQNLKVKDEKGNVSEAISGRPISTVDAQGHILKAPALPTPIRDPIIKWRDEMTRNNTFEDDLTQGIAQFVVPFSMFSKMANVSKATSVLGAAGRLAGAEAAAVGTGFGPHDARGADLLELGRDAEGKFGDVMRKASPDGSMLNAYINYMTDREDEGPWEGRYKNIVDSLALSAATAGLLKAVPFSIKAGRYALENAGTGPAFGSKAAQGGWVGFAEQAAPAAEAPKGPVSLFRGVEVGADPTKPRNSADALFYAPSKKEAEGYGALIDEQSVDRANIHDAGTIQDLLKNNGVDPSRAGHPGSMLEALSNLRKKEDVPEWVKFRYPFDGSPEEFVRLPRKEKK
jgi:hypothetical protein